MMKRGMVAGAILSVVCGTWAADWAQFGGPERNNVSKEQGLADAWPVSGPKVLWKTDVAAGYSGPAVANGKVYLTDREGEKSALRCYDLASGNVLWTCSFADGEEMENKKYAGTRGTPTIVKDRAYLVTGRGMLVCVDVKKHVVVWSHSLLKDYKQELHKFGVAQSPCVYGNLVLVAPYTATVGVAAYDAQSGTRVWTSEGLGAHSFVSPQVVTLAGIQMVVAVGSQERAPRGRGRKTKDDAPAAKLKGGVVAGLSLKEGSTLWKYEGWQCTGAIPHPVPVGNGRLFITGGYKAGSAMIEVKKAANAFAVKEIYTTDEIGPQIQQPILLDGYLYVGNNAGGSNDGLACFDLDGTLKWRTKDVENAPNYERGSFIFADGKLILLDGKTGYLHLVRPNPLMYEELASAPMVAAKDMAWAPLALSDGRLLVRDWNTMKCVDLRN